MKKSFYRRFFGRLGVFCCLLCVMAAVCPSAFAKSPTNWFRIQSNSEGTCIDLAADLDHAAILYSCNSQPWQKFVIINNFTDNTSDSYLLNQYTGACLAPGDDSSLFSYWGCNNVINPSWQLNRSCDDSGCYPGTITYKKTGQCLTVGGSDNQGNKLVQLADCTGASNQYWNRLVKP